MRKRATERLAAMAPVEIAAGPSDLEQQCWELVLFVAVWMGLETHDECVTVLRSIRSLLTPDGRVFAAVTHPCFRDRSFHTYSTSFDMGQYLMSGTRFKVNLFDNVRSLAIWDTHWTLADHVRQLVEAGLQVESLIEPPDLEPASEGVPWLVVVARRAGV
jgi:hypothetical protein